MKYPKHGGLVSDEANVTSTKEHEVHARLMPLIMKLFLEQQELEVNQSIDHRAFTKIAMLSFLNTAALLAVDIHAPVEAFTKQAEALHMLAYGDAAKFT